MKPPLLRRLARLNFSERDFSRLLSKLESLKPPANPLKGRGHKRKEFPLSLHCPASRKLWETIPFNHRASVAIFKGRTAGFGGMRAVSPETFKICAPFFEAVRVASLPPIIAQNALEPLSAPSTLPDAVERNVAHSGAFQPA